MSNYVNFHYAISLA
jgi:hypothetical protein